MKKEVVIQNTDFEILVISPKCIYKNNIETERINKDVLDNLFGVKNNTTTSNTNGSVSDIFETLGLLSLIYRSNTLLKKLYDK